jgi:aspartate dehydrogenase
MHLGLIGYGNIGRELLLVLAREGAAPDEVTILVRDPRRAVPPPAMSHRITTEVGDLIAAAPDLVVECAGQGAVAGPVVACLRAGIETVIASVGALAEPATEAAVQEAAQAGRTRAILPAGAVGAIDLLSALRASGITSVIYTGRKPPSAWRGTPAEDAIDLGSLTAPASFFTGSAREAALRYPKNANVAATLALAGAGFERTEVTLIADPGVETNVHEVSVTAGAGAFQLRIAGKPSPGNPRTSLATVYSLTRDVMNRSRAIVT